MPTAGFANQLIILGHALSVANLTNRDLQIPGLKPAFNERNLMNAELILDLQYLQDGVAPLMGITKPNFTITGLYQNASSRACVISKYEGNKDVTVSLINNQTSSYVNCEAIELRSGMYQTCSEGFSYLETFMERLVFSSQIREIALKYRETVLMTCHDALVIHYRVEYDMMQHLAFKKVIKVNGVPAKDYREVEKIFVQIYQEAANFTLSKIHNIHCVYICTDAKGPIVDHFKNFLHSIKPSLHIYTNTYRDLSDREKGSLLAPTTDDREIRAAVDFEIASLVGKHLIGTKYSTFSEALRMRLGSGREGHILFVDHYLPQT